MNYPLISEYVEAIKLAEDNFGELNYLRPVLDSDGNPVMSSGNFAVVFKMQDVQSGKLYAVRCFHREQTGRAESYKLIEEELNNVSSPYLVSFRYIERELFVDSEQTQETEFPVLLMDWVEGVTLDKYLREHITDKYALEMLAYNFSQLAMWLMPQPFAHGDLKQDNILVRSDGSLVLVDYDGMFVPAMQGQTAREIGSPDFRHPQRTEDDFNERIDDFSVISILLSLKLIAMHHEYLDKYGASDRLLFSANDYADIANCQLLKAVFPSADAELNKLASLFMLCHSAKNLANVSFVLFGVENPQERLSTKVTSEDLANAWIDEYGVKYSQDRKRLLRCSNKKLESYVILESTEVICDSAFLMNIALVEITIPKSVRYIGENTFSCCKALTKATFPDSVFFLGDRAFKDCSALKEITIPDAVKSIGNRVFYNCEALIKITFPKSAKHIGEYAFYGCKALVEVSFPDSLESIAQSAFCGCKSFKKIVIPNAVKSIGDWAFCGCEALAEISLPDSLDSIGLNAFGGCEALKEIVIPKSVTEIKANPLTCCKCHIICHSSHYVFENGILYTAKKDKIISCVTDSNTITIPNSVTFIGNRAFGGCEALKEIVIPDSITSIGDWAFGACSSLTGIALPNSVRSIGSWAFAECKALTKITFPESMEFIGGHVFEKCFSLEEVILPNSVRSIGSWAFAECKALEKIIIPNSIKSINYGAFAECETLKKIVIPNSVVSIEDFAFSGCSSLSEITIPDSVTSVGRGAFRNCKALKVITMPKSVTTMKENPFIGCRCHIICYSPYCSLAKGLLYTANKDKIISCITDRETITIPDTVTSIGDWAFSECFALKKIIIPNSVTSIGRWGFHECSSLEKMVIPRHTKEKFEKLLPKYKDKLIEQ